MSILHFAFVYGSSPVVWRLEVYEMDGWFGKKIEVKRMDKTCEKGRIEQKCTWDRVHPIQVADLGDTEEAPKLLACATFGSGCIMVQGT